MKTISADEVLDRMEDIENGNLDEWEYWDELRRWIKRRCK